MRKQCPLEVWRQCVVLKRDALPDPSPGQGTSRSSGSCIYCCCLLSPWQPP